MTTCGILREHQKNRNQALGMRIGKTLGELPDAGEKEILETGQQTILCDFEEGRTEGTSIP
jgi:hypothetical protein